MPSLPYIRTGPEIAPALLFLHGFMGSKSDWETITERLSDKHNCIAVDLPGHGLNRPTDDAQYSFDTCTRQLAELLDEMDLKRVTPIGYSMGGRLALYFAVRHPERTSRLVLESASPGLATEGERVLRRQYDEELATRLEAESIEQFVDAWYRQPLFASLHRSTRLVERLITDRITNDSALLAKSLRGMGTGWQPSLWDDLVNLEPPTLLLSGDEDQKFSRIAADMADLCRLADHRIIPASGHLPHLENPDAFFTAVEEFLIQKVPRSL